MGKQPRDIWVDKSHIYIYCDWFTLRHTKTKHDKTKFIFYGIYRFTDALSLRCQALQSVQNPHARTSRRETRPVLSATQHHAQTRPVTEYNTNPIAHRLRMYLNYGTHRTVNQSTSLEWERGCVIQVMTFQAKFAWSGGELYELSIAALT